MHYQFQEKLIPGTIKSRPNRFIMEVDIDGDIERAHCPSTGRIGGLEFENIPCLLSKAKNKNRSTDYTVECISIDDSNSWIGINQMKINDYVEFFIKGGFLSDLVKNNSKLKREEKLGRSRIDFKMGNTFLEVKMPLIHFMLEGKERKNTDFNSFDRLIKHFKDLSKNLDKNNRAVLLLCYMYDAKEFTPPPLNEGNKKIQEVAKKAEERGLENWQANFKINKKGVNLLDYFKLDMFG